MDYSINKKYIKKLELRLKKIDNLKEKKDEREVKKHN